MSVPSSSCIGVANFASVLGSGVFTFLTKKSILRAILATLGAYIIIQGCSGIFVLIRSKTFFRTELWVNLAWLGLSFLCFLGLRAKNLWRTLLRLPHTLPHALLVLCGTAWVGKELSEGLDRMLLVLFLLFVVLIQNDH